MAAYHKKAAEPEGRLSNMFYMLFSWDIQTVKFKIKARKM